jgi:hypothetical protein
MMLVLAASACGGTAGDDGADARAFPSSAVAAWLEAVDGGDAAAVEEVVEPATLAVVVAAENGLDAPQTLSAIDEGIPASLAAGYWDEFNRDFSEFSGRALGGLAVGDFEELPGGEFAVVDIGQEESATDVVVVKTDDGWRVDMVATLGVGVIAPLSRAFADLPATETADSVRTAFRERVVPSLQVIADRSAEPALAAEAERLIVEIESYVP